MLPNKKKSTISKILVIAAIFALFVTLGNTAEAQRTRTQNNSKMLYHGGSVLTGTRNLYYIFYGCWEGPPCGNVDDNAAIMVLLDFGANLGNSPYIQINSGYPDASGQAPSGGIIMGGLVFDNSYSHGVDLTRSDVVSIVSDQINNFQLPQDPNGIYIIVSSADVSATEMGFCVADAPPFHSPGIVNGVPIQYVFLGNPRRCPLVAGAPYFVTGGTPTATPNGTFTGDALATNLAHAVNATLSNPLGDGWYDRYGLENADKCANTLGTTYTTSNGGQANMRLGSRDYLLEQNWVNDRKGRCALRR